MQEIQKMISSKDKVILIVADNKQPERTLKTLVAMTFSIKIISFDWIEHSIINQEL